MSLEQIFYLSQSVASIAVIGTLIYLGVQIRDTERNQRAIMQQGRADRVSRTTVAFASSPQLTALWTRVFSANPEFTREELPQMILLWRVAFISGEDSFLQHRSGALDDTAFKSYAAGLRQFMQHPAMRAGWRLAESQYGVEYRAWMDEIISEASRAPPSDSYAQWQRLLREELAAQAS
jgi:hypothetical protein